MCCKADLPDSPHVSVVTTNEAFNGVRTKFKQLTPKNSASSRSPILSSLPWPVSPSIPEHVANMTSCPLKYWSTETVLLTPWDLKGSSWSPPIMVMHDSARRFSDTLLGDSGLYLCGAIYRLTGPFQSARFYSRGFSIWSNSLWKEFRIPDEPRDFLIFVCSSLASIFSFATSISDRLAHSLSHWVLIRLWEELKGLSHFF